MLAVTLNTILIVLALIIIVCAVKFFIHLFKHKSTDFDNDINMKF